MVYRLPYIYVVNQYIGRLGGYRAVMVNEIIIMCVCVCLSKTLIKMGVNGEPQ